MAHKNRTFSIKQTLKFSWKETKEHFWFFAGLLALAFVTYFALDTIANDKGSLNEFVKFSARVVSMILNIIVGMGVIHLSLKVHDQRPVEFDDIVEPINLFGRYFFASLFYGLIVAAGLILFIVPGIYLAVRYGFYSYVMIDKNASIKHSFMISSKITEGVKWKLIGLGVVLGLINILGVIPLGLGLFITIPIGWISAAYVYRHLSR